MPRSPRLLALVVLVALAIVTFVAAQGAPIGDVDTSEGEAVFTANCAACHQATGVGMPTVFPPLVGHVPELLAVEGGREYFVDVVSFGLMGPIDVEGIAYNGMMPSWAHFTNEQLTAVLNYVATAWGNVDALPEGFAAYTVEEVAAIRATPMDMTGVAQKRAELGFE